MEEVILAHKFESLWENEEAKYYKFPDKPYALKVSRIAGALELLSFIIQTSNTRKAGHLVDAATLKISSKEEKYISWISQARWKSKCKWTWSQTRRLSFNRMP